MHRQCLMTVVDPAVVDYLARTCSRGDAVQIAHRMPGLTVGALHGFDTLCRAAHGIQTEVEVAYTHDRLHYRATGPVLSFSDLESWTAGDVVGPCTRGLQWSGYSLKDAGARAGDILYRLLGYL